MFQSIKSHAFAHDVSVLAIGTAIAQVFSFLLYPLIGRLYTPEEMAAFAVFTSIFTVCQSISTGKYETSIFLAKRDADAANIVVLVVSSCILFNLFLYLIIFLFGDTVNGLMKVSLGKLIYLVPVSILSLTLFDTYNEWCIRKKYFSKLSINKISNSILVNGGKVGVAYTPFHSIGLVLGDVLGRFASALTCVVRIFISDRNDFKNVSISGMKEQAKAFDRFPKYQMPSQFLNTLGASVPVLLLTFFYKGSEVGQFSMAIAVMSVPIGVIARAIRDVSRKKIKDSLGIESNIHYIFLSLFKKAFLLSIVIGLALVFFLPFVFSFVLGKQWEQAGVFAQILTPLFIASFVSTCVESPIIVAMKLKQAFFWQLLYSICNILPIIIGSLLGLRIEMTLLLYAISMVICFTILIIMAERCARYLDQQGPNYIQMTTE